MNEKALRILEYSKIIERLEAAAGSAPGKKRCRELTPYTDIEIIERMQGETSDALARLFRKGSVSFSGVTDMRFSLKRLEIGSTLSISELLGICKILETAGRVRSWSRIREDEEPDGLAPMFDALEPLSPLANEIRRCILSEDEIADDASSGLKAVRRKMDQTHDKIRSQLGAMVSGSAKTYLQDSVVTQRNGRFCLPVKAEYRSQVPGMIHDQSSTGSTLFIEPMAIVKLNNDLRELEAAEQKEIEAVLAELSSRVAVNQEQIISDIELLTQLDFIFARAQLAKSYNGFQPIFNTEGYVNIRKGRHPLLDPKKVVPIDIRIGKDFDLLVISGPNTGGKTVSLKTVGLFTLMGQSGLFIPAAEHSELTVFNEVFADIGDEQSIEQSLSTFSAHMTNIVSFWEHADEHSLVLFDELGAGTDPTEGAALAIAILSDLHSRGIRTIATTHYSELKIFALSTPGVENACCEFDVATLRPTYRLLIGVPGKSNAFAISTRLGLPDYIIEEAKGHVSQEAERFEDVVAGLEETRIAVEQEREKLSQLRRAAQSLQKDLENRQQRLNDSRDKILSEAREEAHLILRDAKEFADETIRRYNKMGGSAAGRDMEKERTRVREKLTGLEKDMTAKKATPKKEVKARQLHIGDAVKVLTMNLKGTVSTLPDARGNLYVQMGILRSQVNLKDIELIDDNESSVMVDGKPAGRKQPVRKGGGTRININKSASIHAEINLLGKNSDDAIRELDKYLDDALLAHLPSVRVVHGKGTGKLRQAVHEYLRRHRRVDSYRLGDFGEGDSGVTIVTLK
ncbi:MAG: endonuclease MutS2 [Lachnospiraceae bacterium]|nr:endonuclease MutS2 [Lachnospiraceae bacterium]